MISWRLLVPVVLTVLALSAPAAAGSAAVDQGIVQSATTTSLTIRRLDGTTMTAAVGPSTEIRVNGRAGSIGAIAPGYVARVTTGADGVATTIRALGRAAARTDVGRVIGAVARRLLVRTESGETVTVRVGARTVLRRADGTAARLRAYRNGATVRATYVPGRPAVVVILLARA